ncbi:hypothetical protein GF360_02830 [candidate division WWE3 bacterium]|nr:hypothetical protein [candidate division WWE3 bacterium]
MSGTKILPNRRKATTEGSVSANEKPLDDESYRVPPLVERLRAVESAFKGLHLTETLEALTDDCTSFEDYQAEKISEGFVETWRTGYRISKTLPSGIHKIRIVDTSNERVERSPGSIEISIDDSEKTATLTQSSHALGPFAGDLGLYDAWRHLNDESQKLSLEEESFNERQILEAWEPPTSVARAIMISPSTHSIRTLSSLMSAEVKRSIEINSEGEATGGSIEVHLFDEYGEGLVRDDAEELYIKREEYVIRSGPLGEDATWESEEKRDYL